MKNMKKFASLGLSLVMMLSLAACGGSKTPAASGSVAPAGSADGSAAAAESDLEYVKNKGKLVVGITDFAPMDYKDKDGKWIGFDADNATAFAKSLGVDVEFIEVDWDNKIMELDSKSIDCVWNGMTLTDEVKTSMNCSDPYATNAQVVVVPADKADQYQEIIAVKLLYLRELLYAVSEETVSPHELVARHDIRHRHACLVQHGLYLLRAVAHAVQRDRARFFLQSAPDRLL